MGNLVEKFPCQPSILKVLVQCASCDCDVMMYRKPPDKFVQVNIGFVVVDFFYCSHNCKYNDLGSSHKRRRQSNNRVEFQEECLPTIETGTRDVEAFDDERLIPPKFLHLEGTFLEIHADSTIHHS